MKPDPYALIRASLARRVAGTVIRPLPILTLHPISLVKRRRAVRILSIPSL